MANKILLAFAAADVLFVITGAIMLGFSIVVQNTMFNNPESGAEAIRNLIYQRFPFSAGIANAVLIFFTFVVTLPGMFIHTRRWLKLSGYLISICAVFSMVIGLYLWILTLKTKEDLFLTWVAQPERAQDLLQVEFQCCGYFNSTTPAFVTNAICPSPAAAALTRGCASPITSFANIFIDDIFTTVFGFVGIDALMILATACLLKDRKEEERFRHIDRKAGYRGI